MAVLTQSCCYPCSVHPRKPRRQASRTEQQSPSCPGSRQRSLTSLEVQLRCSPALLACPSPSPASRPPLCSSLPCSMLRPAPWVSLRPFRMAVVTDLAKQGIEALPQSSASSRRRRVWLGPSASICVPKAEPLPESWGPKHISKSRLWALKQVKQKAPRLPTHPLN